MATTGNCFLLHLPIATAFDVAFGTLTTISKMKFNLKTFCACYSRDGTFGNTENYLLWRTEMGQGRTLVGMVVYCGGKDAMEEM